VRRLGLRGSITGFLEFGWPPAIFGFYLFMKILIVFVYREKASFYIVEITRGGNLSHAIGKKRQDRL
jgi:hypothetical protein